MSRPRDLVAAARACAALSLAAAGCASGSVGNPDTAIRIAITAPAEGATVPADQNAQVPIAFTVVGGFTLMDPGTCAGKPSCGHVHVIIDGPACNDISEGEPYNLSVAVSPAMAKVGLCPTVAGAHTFRLELHNDDHSPLKDGSGLTIADSVHATVTGGGRVDGGSVDAAGS